MMTQAEAMARFMPLIERDGRDYTKTALIDARPAVVGEMIVTVTGDGTETTNVAKAGDFVVRNGTAAGEQYILAGSVLGQRYVHLGDSTERPWHLYRARGECRALRYEGEPIEFVANWGAPMVLKPGDMIVTPLPGRGEVYRIAAKEFAETYAPTRGKGE